MSRRGKEIAEKFADLHIQRNGISKSQGSRDSLIRSYLPLAKSVAVVEKAARDTVKARDDLIVQREQMISFLRNNVSQDPQPELREFDPADWEMRYKTAEDDMVKREVNRSHANGHYVPPGEN